MMDAMLKGRLFIKLIPILIALATAGCIGGGDDLQVYIDEVKTRPGGRIEPLPQIKPYETFVYSVDSLRSPFIAQSDPENVKAPTGPTPVVNRNKEYLEQFPLDTLAMVGTLVRDGQTFGLLQTKDGLVHRVLPGNYVGQNDGRILTVTGAKIEIEELVPNGLGSFFKRNAAIGLD